jgi:PadR family transcriptional regulator, regulatory protein PadR
MFARDDSHLVSEIVLNYNTLLVDVTDCLRCKGMAFDRELLKGSIALLILKLLSERDMYGYEIIQESMRRSQDAFEFKEGTLYPALHQLHKRGYLRSEWRTGETGKQRKYYGLTDAGRKAARRSEQEWFSFTKVVNAILSKAHA